MLYLVVIPFQFLRQLGGNKVLLHQSPGAGVAENVRPHPLGHADEADEEGGSSRDGVPVAVDPHLVVVAVDILEDVGVHGEDVGVGENDDVTGTENYDQ